MLASERYIIIEEIASGSTATVYLAEDTVLRRKVALKKLHPHLYNHAEMVKRFAQEAVAIAALSHANIIKVFEYGNQARNMFLAMEYIEGMNLENLLKETSATQGLPGLVALSIFRQLLEGLAAAHARGIYHRDIKPSNVLLDRKGCIRIADFGIAFLSEGTSITRTGSYLGTPGYSAPEQADGREATDRTDIFATGILFYRCLTGRLPFEGETPHAVLRAIMEKVPPNARTLNRKILPGLPELVATMLAKEPQERPSALECISRLEEQVRKLGFFFEPQRLGRFMADQDRYRAEEGRAVAEHFLIQARQARTRGDARSALIAYSLSGTFSEDPADVRRESEQLLVELRTVSRKKILAGVLVGLAVITAGWACWPIRTRNPAPAAQMAAPEPTPSLVSNPLPQQNLVEAPTASGKRVDGGTRSEKAKRLPSGNAKEAGDPSSETVRIAETPFPVPLSVTAVSGPDSDAVTRDAAGYLIVKTSPPFAKLFLDGKEAGSTPTKSPIRVEAGSHELILEREGCRPMHSNFKIAPSETTSLRLILERSMVDAP
jgi:serine/threonine protein kinase